MVNSHNSLPFKYYNIFDHLIIHFIDKINWIHPCFISFFLLDFITIKFIFILTRFSWNQTIFILRWMDRIRGRLFLDSFQSFRLGINWFIFTPSLLHFSFYLTILTRIRSRNVIFFNLILNLFNLSLPTWFIFIGWFLACILRFIQADSCSHGF